MDYLITTYTTYFDIFLQERKEILEELLHGHPEKNELVERLVESTRDCSEKCIKNLVMCAQSFKKRSKSHKKPAKRFHDNYCRLCHKEYLASKSSPRDIIYYRSNSSSPLTFEQLEMASFLIHPPPQSPIQSPSQSLHSTFDRKRSSFYSTENSERTLDRKTSASCW